MQSRNSYYNSFVTKCKQLTIRFYFEFSREYLVNVLNTLKYTLTVYHSHIYFEYLAVSNALYKFLSVSNTLCKCLAVSNSLCKCLIVENTLCKYLAVENTKHHFKHQFQYISYLSGAPCRQCNRV